MLQSQKIIFPDGANIHIEFLNFENPKNLLLIHALVDRFVFIIPRWLAKLTITLYDEAPQDKQAAEACTRADNWEYGFASIDIYAKFFDRTEERQAQIFAHELIHVLHGKLLDFDRNHILSYIDVNNEDLAQHLRRSHTALMEEFVVNLTRIIVDNLIDKSERA